MKKLIYIGILMTVISIGLSSCTEQEVKPQEGGTGGVMGDPKG
jgi:hypothetical protein